MNYYGHGARVEVLTKLSSVSNYHGARLGKSDYATRTFVDKAAWEGRNWNDKTVELAWIDELFPGRRAPGSELAARIAIAEALGLDPKRVGKLSTRPEPGSSFAPRRRGGGGGANLIPAMPGGHGSFGTIPTMRDAERAARAAFGGGGGRTGGGGSYIVQKDAHTYEGKREFTGKNAFEEAKAYAKGLPYWGSVIYATHPGRFVGWINQNGRYVAIGSKYHY